MGLFNITLYAKTRRPRVSPAMVGKPSLVDNALKIEYRKDSPLNTHIHIQVSNDPVFYRLAYSEEIGFDQLDLNSEGDAYVVEIPEELFNEGLQYYIRVKSDFGNEETDWSEVFVYRYNPMGVAWFPAQGLIAPLISTPKKDVAKLCTEEADPLQLYLPENKDPSNIVVGDILYSDSVLESPLEDYAFVKFIGSYPPQTNYVFSVNTNTGEIIDVNPDFCK